MLRRCYFWTICKNGYASLRYSWTTQMSCFHALLSGCSQKHGFEVREGVTGSSSHMPLLLLIFLKALWPRKEMYGMNDAQTAESEGVSSLFIPPGRKKWVQGNDSILRGLSMRRSSGKNNQQHSREFVYVLNWGVKGEATFPFSRLSPELWLLLKECQVDPWCFLLLCKASRVWV